MAGTTCITCAVTLGGRTRREMVHHSTIGSEKSLLVATCVGRLVIAMWHRGVYVAHQDMRGNSKTIQFTAIEMLL